LIFKGYNFEGHFIPTGDGGFVIFDNPLQALVFNALFSSLLLTYNSSRFYPKLRNHTGPIFLRSCMTTNDVFYYNGNLYGPAIINNSRILSKDKLNRFLIDENSHNWFLKKINGIESITETFYEKILQINGSPTGKYISSLFGNLADSAKHRTNPKVSKFKNCHLQKIGYITSKNQTISIYNVEIQLYQYFMDENDDNQGTGFIVSIGNTNSSGISDN
jgi:hypothetical protein